MHREDLIARLFWALTSIEQIDGWLRSAEGREASSRRYQGDDYYAAVAAAEALEEEIDEIEYRLDMDALYGEPVADPEPEPCACCGELIRHPGACSACLTGVDRDEPVCLAEVA